MSEEKSIAGLKVVNVKFETAETGTIRLQFKKAVDTVKCNPGKALIFQVGNMLFFRRNDYAVFVVRIFQQ